MPRGYHSIRLSDKGEEWVRSVSGKTGKPINEVVREVIDVFVDSLERVYETDHYIIYITRPIHYVAVKRR